MFVFTKINPIFVTSLLFINIILENKPTLNMTKKEKEWEETLLRNGYQQLHLTVIREYDFLKELGSYEAVLVYRDGILDKINEKRRILGYLKI